MLRWAAMPAVSLLLSLITHIDAAGMCTHIIMQGGVSGPAALCMELRGARPVESEREAQERATLSDTCQHSHSTSPRTSNIHTHIYKSTQCTQSHTSLSSQTNLYTCSLTHGLSDKSQCDPLLSRFHSLWIGYGNAIQHRLSTTWQTYDPFFTERLRHTQPGVMQLLNAICVNYVEHLHAVEPHWTTGTNWPLKVERRWLNSLTKMNNSFDVKQHSRCCAKVNKRCLYMCVSQMCVRVCAAVYLHEEKHYNFLCFWLSYIVVVLLDDVEVF